MGKATSLKDRVGSYFQNSDKGYARPIEIMIDEVMDIETKKTDTVLEAYILEQELIKKIQPKYNALGKDDKSFSYVVVTKEDFPRFLIVRKTDLKQETRNKKQDTNKSQSSKFQISNSFQIKNLKFRINVIYGPYTSKKQIEIALKILRKIFPYHAKTQKTEEGCLDHQIGLCPGPYAGEISEEDYAKNIRGIKMVLEGKKKNLLTKMKKEMEAAAEKQEFEKATKLRNQIFALNHIMDIALINDRDDISKNHKLKTKNFRIEGYDISNISGQYAVGSMVVFDNANGNLEANKNEYRKFKIKTVSGANDVAMMEEVLMRRFKNSWARPDVLLLDGGVGHLNITRRVLRRLHLDIPILAVAKGPTRKKLDLRTFGTVPEIPENIITQIRDEAHRFAIGYHRKLRKNGSLQELLVKK